MKNLLLIFYITLPFILWPLVFVVFKEFFWVLMPLATTILGIITLAFFKDNIILGGIQRSINYGISSAIALYLIFIAGDYTTRAIGIAKYVDIIYELINTSLTPSILIIGLTWIGVMEEIYWRGGLQGIFHKKGYKTPWLISSILYSIVHTTTLNPVLVISALIVGLILGIIAYKSGIIASSIAHIIWLQMIIILLPLR